MSKQDILSQIVTLATQNGISTSDIEFAMVGNKPEKSLEKSSGIAMKIFSILGGIFIFAGISSYIGMFWGDMNSAMRVIITLGSGFVAYLIGVTFFRNSRYPSAVAPIMLVAAFMECGGLFVMINEYFNNNTNNWRLACLIVFGLMLLQQGLTFLSMWIPILLFTTLWFGGSFFAIAFDMLGVPERWNIIFIGLSLLLIAYGLRTTIYQRTLQLAYLVGSILFLLGMFDVLRNTPFEILYLAITCFMIYMSVMANSTTLLVVSVLAMLSYIGYFTAENFVNSVGWPLSLIILGILFFMISAGAVRIKKKYIQ
ncbi:MAG: DUF2157 domain-containing protein [Pseudomonadota bacterium]